MRYFADHVNDYGQEIRIEIIESQSTDDFKKFKGDRSKGFYRFSHQKIDIENPYSNPVQRGAIDVSVMITNEEQLGFIKDIIASQEGDYKVVYKIDNNAVWIGDILPDLCEFDEMSFDRQSATISARDFSSLSAIDYPAADERKEVIKVIADILDNLGYDLDLFTATSWTDEGISESNDFLRQIYVDTFALQRFGRGGEDNIPITSLEALERICRNFGLIIKQWDGYRIDQITAYQDASNVIYAKYDKEGVLIEQNTEDRRNVYNFRSAVLSDGGILADQKYIRNVIKNLQGADLICPMAAGADGKLYFQTDPFDNQRVVIGSTNRGIPGIKRALVRFDHRTTIQNIQFPPVFTLTDDPLTRSFTQFFNSDGNQALLLTGTVEARFDDDVDVDNIVFILEIKIGDFYWDIENSVWDDSEVISNKIDMIDAKLTTDNKLIFLSNLEISTLEIPDGAGPDLEIKVFAAREEDTQVVADFTEYLGFNLTVINPSVEEGQNTAINYRLVQENKFSVEYNHGDNWYGDGPTSYARSAISTDDQGENLTSNTWFRRGETDEIDFHNLLLREMMDFQRSHRRNLSGIIKGIFIPEKIQVYDGVSFYYIGGDQDGDTGTWNPEFIEIDIQTAETDDFAIIYQTAGDEATGPAPPTGTGGGLTQTVADARYFRRRLLLGEIAITDRPVARDNLGLGALAVLDEVDTAEITDNAVTEAKLADDSVGTAKVQDDAVTTDKIDNDAVTEAKLADDSVSTDKVQDNAVTLAKVPFADQNVRQTDIPTFEQLTLSIAGSGVNNAVRADRTLRLLADDDSVVSWDPSTAQNLTNNRQFKPTFLDASTSQRGLIGIGSQAIGGDKTFHDDVKLVNTSKFISDAGFTSGFTGVGFRHSRVDSRWKFETDDLLVRGALFAYEFIVKQISAINGSDVLSAGVGKIEEIINDDPSFYQVKVSDATGKDISPFVEGDIVLIQQVDPNVYNETPAGGQIVKRIVGQVDIVSDVTVTVITQDGTDGTDVGVGDIMVVIGSQVLARQNLIHRSVIEANAPFTRVLSGVDTVAKFSDPDNVIVQYGNLDSLTTKEPDVSGIGLYTSKAFLTDSVVIGDLSETSNYLSFDGSKFDLDTEQFNLESIIELDASTPDHRELRLKIQNNDEERIFEITKTPIDAGVPGAEEDKIVFKRNGDAFFGGDIELSGQIRNTTNAFQLDDETGVPDAVVNATDTDTNSYNFDPLDGTPNPDQTPPRHNEQADEREVVRFWAEITLLSSFTITPEYRMVIEGHDGSSWSPVDHNDAFGIIADVSGAEIRNFNVDNFTGYLQFLADQGSANMQFKIVGYYYGKPQFNAYRIIIKQAHGQTGGTSRVDSSRVRVFQRTTRMNRNGFFIIDADVIKRGFTALEGDTLISTPNDFVA